MIKFCSALTFSVFTFIISPSFAQVSWMKSNGSTNADEGNGVVCDAQGNVYMIASFRNLINLDTFQLNYFGNQDGIISKVDSTGKIIWAKSFGGVQDDHPTSLALSKDGYLIIAGSLYDSAQFGNLTIYGRGYTDAFIAKVDTANGDFIWVKTAGSNYGYEEANCVSIDSLNNCWVGGYFLNSMIAETDTMFSNGSVDFFILKYDNNGNLLESKSFGGPGVDNLASISCDGNSNIYFCGAFSDTMQVGTFSIASAGNLDIFWAKMDVAGNILWVKTAGGTSTENVSCIKAFRNGSYYISGWVQDSAWIEGELLIGNSGDIFLTRYDNTNQFQWVKQGFSIGAGDLARNITLDKYNNVYLAGQANFVVQRLEDIGGRSEASEDACPFGDLVFMKYDTVGTLIWMEHTLSTNYNIANGIAIDNLGNCFVTGYYSDSIWLASLLRTSNGGSDILLFRFHDQTFYILNGVGNNTPNDFDASLYPNPAENDIYINLFSNEGRRPCSIKLFSIQGKEINKWKIYLDEGMNFLQLKSDASPGMYVLMIESGNQQSQLKLILH